MSDPEYEARKRLQCGFTKRRYPLQTPERNGGFMASIIGPNGRPAVSREQQAMMAIEQMRTNLYLSLIPVVASKRIAAEPGAFGYDGQVDAIAQEADEITIAALKRMGIEFKSPAGGTVEQ